MRIGEVNKDNYKYFLALFGAKDNKTLENLMGGGDAKGSSTQAKNIDPNYEEGMDGDEGWGRNIPISDEVRDKLIATVRRQFLENGNGMSKAGGVDGDEIGAIMKEYRKNIPPSDRLAVTGVMSTIVIEEQKRLVAAVKANNPSWNFGQLFDKEALLKSNYGTNSVDIKA